MIFAISPGTDGDGDPRFSAYLPFALSSGRTISDLETSADRQFGSETLTVEKLHSFYALALKSFSSEDAAAVALAKLQAALLWVSLKYKVGVSYSRTLGEIEFFDEPAPVPTKGIMAHVAGSRGWSVTEGHYGADKCAIRPEHRKLARWEVGSPSVHVGIGLENLFAALSEAFSHEKLEAIRTNKKLELALEIYGSFAFESSDNAQLLTLVTALEALLPDKPISPVAVQGLERAKDALKEHRAGYPCGSAEWKHVERLLSRLGKLRYEAIGATMGDFAHEVTSRHRALGRPEAVAGKLQNVYAVRSRLLHGGVANSVKIKEALAFLRDFVPRLLEMLFSEAVSGR